jgi:acetyltransferase-like isoleucine patch superfamily enzyme
MSIVRSSLRTLRDGAHAARFRAWTARLDLELRRNGGRLVLDAPHGLRFDSPPKLKVRMRGEGDGTFTLRVGRGVTVGRNMVIEVWAQGTNVLDLGDDSYALNGVILQMRGGTLRLGPRSNLRDYAILKTEGDLILGDEVTISPMSALHCTRRLELGDYVGTGERVTMIDSEKRHDGSDTHFLRQDLRVAPVTLERNVFVAANAVITHGSHVGQNSVIGAGAVLTGGDYPSGSIIVGSPAKAVKRLPRAAQGPEPDVADDQRKSVR